MSSSSIKLRPYKKFKAEAYFDIKKDLYIARITNIADNIEFTSTSIENLPNVFHVTVKDYLKNREEVPCRTCRFSEEGECRAVSCDTLSCDDELPCAIYNTEVV